MAAKSAATFQFSSIGFAEVRVCRTSIGRCLIAVQGSKAGARVAPRNAVLAKRKLAPELAAHPCFWQPHDMLNIARKYAFLQPSMDTGERGAGIGESEGGGRVGLGGGGGDAGGLGRGVARAAGALRRGLQQRRAPLRGRRVHVTEALERGGCCSSVLSLLGSVWRRVWVASALHTLRTPLKTPKIS